MQIILNMYCCCVLHLSMWEGGGWCFITLQDHSENCTQTTQEQHIQYFSIFAHRSGENSTQHIGHGPICHLDNWKWIAKIQDGLLALEICSSAWILNLVYSFQFDAKCLTQYRLPQNNHPKDHHLPNAAKVWEGDVYAELCLWVQKISNSLTNIERNTATHTKHQHPRSTTFHSCHS